MSTETSSPQGSNGVQFRVSASTLQWLTLILLIVHIFMTYQAFSEQRALDQQYKSSIDSLQTAFINHVQYGNGK